MENKVYDVVVMGPISKDHNIDFQDNEVFEIGGAVFYSTFSAAAGGAKVASIIMGSEEDRELTSKFKIPTEDIYYIPFEKTTTIQNKYFTENKERRNSIAIAQCPGIKYEDMPKIETKLYHLAGLLYGDFSEELIEQLSEESLVSVDVQGFLRHNVEGKMVFKDWEKKLQCLKNIRFLKTDAAEAEILTGVTDRKEGAKILYGFGAQEVLISHNSEILVYDGEKYYTQPIKARNLSGRTGRGDTVFGAYISERVLGKSIEEALLYATAMVSYKMESPGGFSGDRHAVEEYIRMFY